MAEGGRDAIIFLDKNRFFVYDGNDILRVDIPETIIRDVDVVDKSGFDSLVDNFIKTKKLDPAQIWLILADGVCFNKDIIQTDPIQVESEIRDFLDAVPFDQILSKRYKADKGVRIITSNLEYIEAVIEIFARNEFVVVGVVPSAIFPVFNTKKILDTDFAKNILENKSLMRSGNMLARVNLPVSPTGNPEPKKKSKLLPFLIGGFVLLLTILIIVIVSRG